MVLCDRYVESIYAYQGASLSGKMEYPERWIYELHRPFLIEPDLIFYLRIPLEIAIKRKKSNLIEEYLRRVSEIYEKRMRLSHNCHIIDGENLGIEESRDMILGIIHRAQITSPPIA